MDVVLQVEEGTECDCFVSDGGTELFGMDMEGKCRQYMKCRETIEYDGFL